LIMTKSGSVAFSSMTFPGDNQLLIFLATGTRVASTTERTMQWTQRVLYHIRNMVVATIGVKEVSEELGKGVLGERAKRMFKEIGNKIECMF